MDTAAEVQDMEDVERFEFNCHLTASELVSPPFSVVTVLKEREPLPSPSRAPIS